jgi:hypothetical protein
MHYGAALIIALFILAALFIAVTYEDPRDPRHEP